MLGWNRLLLAYGQWQRGGPMLSLAGALVPLAFLIGLSPRVGLVAGPSAWVRALAGFPHLLSGLVPETVLLLVGLLLWFRAVRLSLQEASLPSTWDRFRWSALLALVLLLEGGSRGAELPVASAYLLAGFGLSALALARAHSVTSRAEGGLLGVPFSGRWLGALLAGVGGALGLGLLATIPLSFQAASWLWAVLAPLRLALGLLFAGLVYLLSLFLLPIIRFLVQSGEPITGLVPPPLMATPSPVAQPPLSADARWLLDAVLIVGILAMAGIFLFVLYRVLQQVQGGGNEEMAEMPGGYGRVRGNLDAEWLKRAAGSLRKRFGRARPEVGLDSVRDLYRHLLLFGDEHGLPRPTEETPYEYLGPLCSHYPQRRDDFFSLTEAYVASHYGERPFSPAEVERLRDAWERIAQESLIVEPPVTD